LDDVYVATCDIEIYEYIKSIGGNAIMTSNVHERATERSAEALINVEKDSIGILYDIVVMIQGDEPLINPLMISEVIQPLYNRKNEVSNLMARLKDLTEAANSNFVKVVTDTNGRALYFSREPIPSPTKYKKEIEYFRQLGLIAFTRKAILSFVKLSTTRLEIIESVDMNRFLENQVSIQMSITEYEADSVDTVEDLTIVADKMKRDSLYPKYKLD
jgi:3-deoxy-manno-octulosonate cytidylyltransferase (CMP-KDO synthetase)